MERGPLPLVSVVIAARNEEAWIAGAIESILRQTYRHWDLVVVDDGSTDNTTAVASAYRDRRITVVRRDPAGLAQALNDGISRTRGELIARLDADDAALPRRLERQVAFMQQNPEVALLGSQAWYETAGGWRSPSHYPTSDREIRQYLRRDNPFVHSSVVMRRAAWEAVGGYSSAHHQDYDLWVRLAARYRVAILDEPLVVYRVRAQSVSHRASRHRRAGTRLRQQLDACRRLGWNAYGVAFLARSLCAWACLTGIALFERRAQ